MGVRVVEVHEPELGSHDVDVGEAAGVALGELEDELGDVLEDVPEDVAAYHSHLGDPFDGVDVAVGGVAADLDVP